MNDLIHATVTVHHAFNCVVFCVADAPLSNVSDIAKSDIKAKSGIKTLDIKTLAEVGAVRAMPPHYRAARFKCLAVVATTLRYGITAHHVILANI